MNRLNTENDKAWAEALKGLIRSEPDALFIYVPGVGMQTVDKKCRDEILQRRQNALKD
jgi:hypothetical protein